MATFVLVHGAWLGGWVWKEVAALLREAGHEVYTPTLTGLGERSHLANREIGLDTHICDVVQVLEYEDLWDVVLVGHSYGGMVITSVADCVPDRLAHLVYLDAFVPDDGQSLHDLVPTDGSTRDREMARREGDGWRIPLEEPWCMGTNDVLRWMHPYPTDQPLRSFDQPLYLT